VLVPIVLQPVGLLSGFVESIPGQITAIDLSIRCVPLVGSLFFVIFLALLADWIGNKPLRNVAWSVIVFGAIACGSMILMLTSPWGETGGAAAGIIVLLSGLAALLRYIGLLAKLRQAVLAYRPETP
jgi:hypothetical protein